MRSYAQDAKKQLTKHLAASAATLAGLITQRSFEACFITKENTHPYGWVFSLVAEAGVDVRLTGKFFFVGSAARFAVPEKIIGLALFLDFFDRCTLTGLASSATGSASPVRPNELRSSSS